MRLVSVTQATTLYDKPCGCESNPHFLLEGILQYETDLKAREWDLYECRQCGAVWTERDRPHVQWIPGCIEGCQDVCDCDLP